METLAFIHTAVAYEDPNPKSELRSFDNISLKAPGSIALGVLSAGVVTATLSHADQAQALLMSGDRGSGVAQLQQKLGGIRVDGVFGPETYYRLISHQKSRDLLADGKAGPATLPTLGLPAYLGSFDKGQERNTPGSSLVTARIGLVVRDSPNGGYLYTLPYGSRVTRDGYTVPRAGYNWTKIGGGGWVASEYLDNGSGSAERPVPAGPFADVRTNLLVRNGPNGRVIGSVGSGGSLRLTGAEQFAGGRTWSQLSSGGWVARDYIGFR
ncbi:peptidoglycan-binding protein [Stenomitos frigidus]|uniref:Peptidoglycan binding-like domain-containing protein n=1 Tax=Stenomitos frigidus ULC18 TaxID=2107698 RepID=A0A2T1E2P3_9CYAN|nr:peptidoglycan-binding protein [Stenomitos frigidus]PSB26990.1 hypothetical protein C7B82_17695 [Stenomitos frigidus ULC18]